MTSCKYYQELISRMLDDDLTKAERDELAAHVKTCPDCAAVYVAFRSLSEHLGADLEEVPASVHENIMAEVRRDSLRARNSVHRSHRRWHTALTVAACLVMIVAASLSLPKIVGQKTAMEAAPAAAEQFLKAEEPMMEEAATEEDEAAYDIVTGSELLRNADSSLDEAPAEVPAEVPAPQASISRADGMIILDSEQSAALLDALRSDAVSLDRKPDREIRVLLQKDDSAQPLTILLCGDDTFYVRADGDSYSRIDMNAEELLSLLGLNE